MRLKDAVECAEVSAIAVCAVKRCGIITEILKEAGVSRSTFYRKLKVHGLRMVKDFPYVMEV